jgi:hypothetical protein
MRRLLLPTLAAALALSGCGDERPGTEPQAGPRPTVHATTPTTDGSVTLAGFPLALGYAEENEDDHSPVVVTARPATRTFELCGRTVWDPRSGSSDVIGVEFRGEAEWWRGRTLVLYPALEAATRAVATARDAVAACPEERIDEHGSAAHTVIDYVVGDESFGWIDRWRNDEVGGLFGTGLTVYHVARVGRAVLLSYEYGEGNGSDESREAAIGRAAEADQPVVDAMGGL